MRVFDDPRRACQGVDPAVFYELTPVNKEMALALCGGCPVRDGCLEYVMSWETGVAKFGIWGGLTPRERGALVKGRSRKAKAKAA